MIVVVVGASGLVMQAGAASACGNCDDYADAIAKDVANGDMSEEDAVDAISSMVKLLHGSLDD